MRISFVIPAYNEEALIGGCLESILAEIVATIDPATRQRVEAEVVVVNNASTDSTRSIAGRYSGVVVLDELQKGPVRARKKGFEHSRGELVAILDADIIMPKGWLATVLAEFAGNKKLAALSGPYIYYDLPGFARLAVKFFYFWGWLTHLFTQHVLRVGAMLQGGNIIVTRSALIQAGGFDTSIEFYGDDTDLACRLCKVGLVKWSWKLPMLSSGRRLKAEGILTMSYKYTINYLWVTFFGRPLTRGYKAIRPK